MWAPAWHKPRRPFYRQPGNPPPVAHTCAQLRQPSRGEGQATLALRGPKQNTQAAKAARRPREKHGRATLKQTDEGGWQAHSDAATQTLKMQCAPQSKSRCFTICAEQASGV